VATRRLSTTLVSNQNVSAPAYLVGSGGASATSVTIPAHRPGDLIVMYVKASAQNILPSIPTASGTVPSWQLAATTDRVGAANTTGVSNYLGCSRLCFYVATANNHTSGTWTNATGMMAAVVRRASSLGAVAISSPPFASSPWTAPAAALFRSNNTSLILHFYGWGDGSNTAPTISAAPTGYTRQFDTRTSLVGLALNTKNVTTSAPAVDQATGTGAIWHSAITVEVLAL